MQGGRPHAQRSEDIPFVPPEPNWLFSNRSHWYPQGQVTDYATAHDAVHRAGRLHGRRQRRAGGGSPTRSVRPRRWPAARRTSSSAAQPLRYIGVVVSKFTASTRRRRARHRARRQPRQPRTAPAARSRPPSASRNTVALASTPIGGRQERGRDIVGTAAEILRLYASLVGDVPYDAMTLAMVEHDRPGGHSPGYFAVLNNPLPMTPFDVPQRSGGRSTTSPSSTSRTRSRISGGARRSAGRTITSSG